MSKSLQVWAERYNIKETDAERLVYYASMRKHCAERELNGDQYPSGRPELDSYNKPANSLHWSNQLDVYDKLLWELAQYVGFTGMHFNGLFPSFDKGDEKFISLPNGE